MTTTLTNLDAIGNVATTQIDYPFNSFALVRGKLLAANDNGLFEIGNSKFGNTDIISHITTFSNKLGHDGIKRLRYIYLGIETEGEIVIVVTADDKVSRTITVTPESTGQQHIRIPIGRDIFGVYWSFRVENVDGCWFSLEEMSCLPINLSMGRK